MSAKDKTQELIRKVQTIPELASWREEIQGAKQEVHPVTLDEARASTAHLRCSQHDSVES